RNIAIGRITLQNMSYGEDNIAIGTYAGQGLIGGYYNIYIGPYVASNVTYETGAIRIGNPVFHSITYLINPHAYINGAFYKIHADSFRITDSNNMYIGYNVDGKDDYEAGTIRIGNPDSHSITCLINPHAYINGAFYKIHADKFRITDDNEI